MFFPNIKPNEQIHLLYVISTVSILHSGQVVVKK